MKEALETMANLSPKQTPQSWNQRDTKMEDEFGLSHPRQKKLTKELPKRLSKRHQNKLPKVARIGLLGLWNSNVTVAM